MTSVQHIYKTAFKALKTGGNVVVHSLYPNHFHCFCHKLYYLSNFKDFNTLAPD